MNKRKGRGRRYRKGRHELDEAVGGEEGRNLVTEEGMVAGR